MMYHILEGFTENCTRWQLAKLVLPKIGVFYEKANIPMISERQFCEMMIALLDSNAKVRAILAKRRSSETSLNKIKAIEDKLKSTLPLAIKWRKPDEES